MSELFCDQLRGVGVDHVVDGRHVTLLHQHADHIDAALGHAVGKLLNGDRLRNDDFADQLFLRLVGGVPFQALGAAAERSDGTFADFIDVGSVDHGEAGQRRFGAAARVGFGAITGRVAPGAPGLRMRGASSSSATSAGTCDAEAATGCRGVYFSKPLLGFLFGLALGFFLAAMAILFLALARFGGFALGLLHALAALRRRASSSAILRSSASRTRASASACARALRSSSVSVRSTTPDFGAGAAGAGFATRGAGVGAFFGAAWGAGSAALVSTGLPTVRRFTVSTTTCLERPWLKLWRTTPVSVRGFSDSVLPTLIFLSPGVFVSLIAIPFPFQNFGFLAGRAVRPRH